MKLSLNTYAMCADWDFGKIINFAGSNGYAGIEFRIQRNQKHGVEIGLDKRAREEVREKVRKAGLEISCISTSVGFFSADPDERAKNVATAKEIIRLTQDLGAGRIKVGANLPPEGIKNEDFIDYVSICLRECGEFARDFNVDVLLEMHVPFFSQWQNALAAVKKANCERVGLLHNCEQQNVVNGSIADNYEHVKQHIRHVHIHDLENKKVFFPYTELFRLLNSDGYKGFFSVEIESSAFGENVVAEEAFAKTARKYTELMNTIKQQNLI